MLREIGELIPAPHGKLSQDVNKAQSGLSSSFHDAMAISRARTVQPVSKAMATTGERPCVDLPDNIVLLRYEERRPLATVKKESFPVCTASKIFQSCWYIDLQQSDPVGYRGSCQAIYRLSTGRATQIPYES